MTLMNYVKALEGKSDSDRRCIILKILEDMGYNYKTEKYSYLGYEGVNIVVSLGKGKKQILAVTHYDAVPGSPGANDNASTIAVLFDVLRRLKKYKPKNNIKLIIFDEEEIGCIGSRAYIKKHGIKDIIAVYNMELVGMGDMIGIWPVTKAVQDSQALKNLKDTIKKLGYYHEEAGALPLFFGDYKPFREAGIKDAFCISVVSKEEKDSIRKFVETSQSLLTLKLTLGLLKIPRMFQLYHSSEDKSKYLNESALKMTSDVLFNALVNMDKKFRRKF